ncbi:hypothetical protein QVD17_16599 [Tagetes erecta]|uniref:Uncharacterized protein n=1 Tax=Tagetes erecta TaxID=13708 RepID=A0AAD8KY59_TARER|nr:hypothetical protein QVD17_16599 [Tagetes erecta]
MLNNFARLADLPNTETRAEAFLKLGPSIRTFIAKIQNTAADPSLSSSCAMSKRYLQEIIAKNLTSLKESHEKEVKDLFAVLIDLRSNLAGKETMVIKDKRSLEKEHEAVENRLKKEANDVENRLLEEVQAATHQAKLWAAKSVL